MQLPLREDRRRNKEIEERKFAIIRNKFACYCKTLYKQIVIVKNTNTKESKRRRGERERERKGVYLDTEKGEPSSGFSKGQCPLLYS